MLSTFLPSVSGGIVKVTGEEVVATGLRGIHTFVATFKANNFVPDQESKVSWYVLNDGAPTVSVALRVEKGGANDGTLGTNPVDISWLALGE